MFKWVTSLDSFFTKVKIRYLGLGLLLAWVYCSWFSGSIFGPESEVTALETLRTSLLFSAFSLIAIVFRPHKQHPLGSRIVFISAVCVSATTSLFFFIPSGWLLIVISAIGGIMTAFLWVAWGELYCQLGQEVTESCIPTSLVAFVVACVAVYVIPWPIAGILSAIFPLVSCIMLLLAWNARPDDYAFPKPASPFSQVFPSLAKLAVCSMTCSIANGFVVTGFVPDIELFSHENMLFFYIVGGLAAAIISMLALSYSSKLNFSLLYNCVIPMIVFSLSLKALGGVEFLAAAFVLACAAALCVEALFYAIFTRITIQRYCLPSETFGIFRAAAQAGFLLGGVLNLWVSQLHIEILPMCLLLICVCVVMLPLFLHLQRRFDSPVKFVVSLGEEEASQGVRGEVANKNPIHQIIAEYSLSPREAEVLGFLSKGRSVPYMREAMTLSKSTIETHIKHIYAKLDVHSKQELLDLIERYQERAGK